MVRLLTIDLFACVEEFCFLISSPTICIGRAEVIYLCMIIIHFFALKTFNFDAEVHDERKYERNKSGEKINDEILSLVS